jgi:hypothetical protein
LDFSSLESTIEDLATSAGEKVAEKMKGFLNRDDFSLGEGLGYVTGMIIFEVILAIVTGGAWAAVRMASVPLNALLRVIRAGDKITRAMLGTVVAMGRPIMKGFGAAAGLLGRIPGVSSIVRRAREGLRRLFRSADEAASGGGKKPPRQLTNEYEDLFRQLETQASPPTTWNQFQSQTSGRFSSRRETADAWTAYKNRAGLATPTPIASSRQGTKPSNLQRMEQGRQFNLAQRHRYDHRELYIEKPGGNGYFILDSYNTRREIVSRKHTQLAEIQEQTALRYIKELPKKYPPGAKIADVPSTSPTLVGKKLEGAMILEVPVQNGPVLRSIIEVAENLDVVIRDINGKVY